MSYKPERALTRKLRFSISLPWLKIVEMSYKPERALTQSARDLD